jgi:ribosomal protein S18 acetylase RimI-like enzyme
MMIRIRKALAEDCPGIAQVQVDSYRTAYVGLFPEPYLAQLTYEEQAQDWQAWLETNADDLLLVALSADNQVIGYVLARAQPDIYPGYDAEILALHVKLPHQGNGIGGALLRATIAEFMERGCRSVMLWTLKGNPVRQWYERLGGRPLGEKSFQIDDWEIVEVAYGWETMSMLLPGDESKPAEDPDLA